MSFGKMNIPCDIIRVVNCIDEEGFSYSHEEIIATIRVYQEGRHGSLKWANLSTFSTATDLFCMRVIPNLEIKIGDYLVNSNGRYEITSIENVKGKGIYYEILAKREL